MGIQNGQNRIGGRPEPQKKNGNFPQWQMLMVTLRRVDMSQSAEPFRIDSSQSAQVFSKFGSIPASLLSHVESIPKKNEPSRSEAIIVDGWCSGSFLLIHRLHALTADVDWNFRVQVDCIMMI